MDQCFPKAKPSLPPKPGSLTFKNKCKSLSSYHINTTTRSFLSNEDEQTSTLNLSSETTPSSEDVFNNNNNNSIFSDRHLGSDVKCRLRNSSSPKSSLNVALQPKIPKEKPLVPTKLLYRSGGTMKVIRAGGSQSFIVPENFKVEKLKAAFEELKTQSGLRINSMNFISDDLLEQPISPKNQSSDVSNKSHFVDEVKDEESSEPSPEVKSTDSNNNENVSNKTNSKENHPTIKQKPAFVSPPLARISIKRSKPRVLKINTLPHNLQSINPPSSDKTTTKFPADIATTIITTTSHQPSPKQIDDNLDVLIPVVTDTSTNSRSSRRSGRKSKVQMRARSECRDKLTSDLSGDRMTSLVELNDPENTTSTSAPEVQRSSKKMPLYLSMDALGSRNSSCSDLNQQVKFGRVEELINESLGGERMKQTGTPLSFPPKSTNPLSPTSTSSSLSNGDIFSPISMKVQETTIDTPHGHDDDKRKSSDSSNDNYGTLSDSDDEYVKREDIEERTSVVEDSDSTTRPSSDYLPLFGRPTNRVADVALTADDSKSSDDTLSYCSSSYDDVNRFSVSISNESEIKRLIFSSGAFIPSSLNSPIYSGGGGMSSSNSFFTSSSNSSSSASLNASFSFGTRSNSIDVVSHSSAVKKSTTNGGGVAFEGGESLEGRLNKSDSIISCPQLAQLPKRAVKNPFLVAKEIMTSEEKFIGVLTLLNEKFPEFIQSERAQGRATDGPSDVRQLFHDLPNLQEVNKELLKQLKQRIENWDKDPRIADIFVRTGHFLKLYTNYIKNFSHVVQEFDATRKKNPEFDKALTEFENLPSCDKLALRHYMLKPIQRIPQYKLLLQEYLKCLTPDSPDYNNAKDAIPIVAGVSEHANESVRYWENQCKMINIQSMLGGFQLIKPGRRFIKEGKLMKLSRKEMQARMFFLFNDLLLYTTPLSANSFKVNQAISLDGLTVNCPTTEDIENEFSIISVERSFTVAASSKEEKEQWVTALELAVLEDMETKANLEAMKQRRIMSSLGTAPCSRSLYKPVKTRSVIVGNGISSMYESSFKIGDRAPVWIQDDRASMCMACIREFSVTFRRHHCRGCGKIVCSNCSKGRAPLKYNGYKPARVCIECFEYLKNNSICEVGEIKSSITEEDDSNKVERKDSMLPSTPSTAFKNMTLLFKGRHSNPSLARSLSKPSILTEVQAFDSSSEMCGFLHQLEKKKWRRFWFVLKGKVMYTFRAMQDKAAIRTMPLLSYNVQDGSSGVDNDEKMFELFHDGLPPITFRAETCALKLKWIEALQKAMTI